MAKARTLGELRRVAPRSGGTVRDEMRRNLVRKLEAGERLFPGLLGYDDTVLPQVVGAVLSRHSMILLGLRGQAKSRLLRSLTELLDPELPVVEGCEINDDPEQPLCRRCLELVAEAGDETPLAWLAPQQRYVEKLATPDVTIADIIGDIDPIRAARGGHDLASEHTMHYGLLPRAHRGIFALNELPDLAGRIQVGLFNILEEGDVQIKGYPIRLPLELCLVFTANPEDYTARGKIVTPLKDRIGSEIRTHYPESVERGVAITRQEAWTERGSEVVVPRFIREIVEGVAFAARQDKKVDSRSGVSQRLSISTLENTVSSAERRAFARGERPGVARVADVEAALPAITGKLELEYEGELAGAERVARALIRKAVGETFSVHVGASELGAGVAYFEAGGSLRLTDEASSKDALHQLDQVPGLLDVARALVAGSEGPPGELVSAAEFILEGLCAQKKIGRSPDGGFVGVKPPRQAALDLAQLERLRKLKRQVN